MKMKRELIVAVVLASLFVFDVATNLTMGDESRLELTVCNSGYHIPMVINLFTPMFAQPYTVYDHPNPDCRLIGETEERKALRKMYQDSTANSNLEHLTLEEKIEIFNKIYKDFGERKEVQ